LPTPAIDFSDVTAAVGTEERIKLIREKFKVAHNLDLDYKVPIEGIEWILQNRTDNQLVGNIDDAYERLCKFIKEHLGSDGKRLFASLSILSRKDVSLIKDIHVSDIATYFRKVLQDLSLDNIKENDFPLTLRLACIAEIRRKLQVEHNMDVTYREPKV